MINSQNWKFRHIGMIVRDLDAAIAQYQTLGFTVVKERFIGSPKIPNPPKTDIVHMASGGLTIELLQPLAGQFINMEFLETIGDGVNHACFQVEDLPAERQALIDAGFPVLYEAEIFAYFDTRKAGNMIIELRNLP